jgi:hypothetical protein
MPLREIVVYAVAEMLVSAQFWEDWNKRAEITHGI